MKRVRLSPAQILRLIDQGREDEIPKSKTWHRFMKYYKQNSVGFYALARMIDIPSVTLDKFIKGTFVISQTNMKKIQKYLNELGEK